MSGFLATGMVGFLAGCDRTPGQAGPGSDSSHLPAAHNDLLVGYELLASSLSGESGLGKLRVFKKLALSAPPPDVEETMRTLAQASRKRAHELRELRKLSPDVTGHPPPSRIGDAIQKAATEAGKHDMLHPDGSFSARYLFLQAQAVRMIGVIAGEIAKLESNTKRRSWLAGVAAEYESYHEDLVALVETHCAFKGDDTKN